MDMCRPFRPRSGACHRCFHLRPSGEASQPGLHAPAGTLPPNPARILMRFARIRSTSARSASRLSVSDRWPCATGLVSYPSSCFFFSHSDDPVFGASRCSDLITLPRSSPFCRRLPVGAFNPRQSVSFFPSRLRHRQVAAASIQFVQNRWMADHHTGSQ